MIGQLFDFQPVVDLLKDLSTCRLAQAVERTPRVPVRASARIEIYRGVTAVCALSAGAGLAEGVAALAESSDFLYLGSLR